MVLPAPADAEAHSDLPENGQGEEGPSRPRRPPEFYSSVFAQIEEVGWERLVSAAGDDGVSCLTFRVMDEHGRDHLLEITFTLPAHELSCMSSFHCRGCSLSPKITVVKKLKTERCSLPVPRDIARLLDDIDKVLWVVDPTKPSYAMSHRRIALGDDCYILLHVDAHKPGSLPDILYNRGVYPEESFAKVKKYGLTMLLTQDKGVKAFIANITSQLSASFPSRSPYPPQFLHWLQIAVSSPCCLRIDLLCG